MKYFALAVILFVAGSFITSCGPEKPKNKKKEKEVLVEIKDGVYTEYYPGRKAIKFRGQQTEDSLRTGRWFFYAENGTEQSTTEYVNGKKNGLTTVRYPGGNMRYTGFYTDDKESGEWRFYKEDGTIDFIKNFDSIQ